MTQQPASASPAPSFFEAAVDWTVSARVEPREPGTCVVAVMMMNREGMKIGIGAPFVWPENYEDRDMEAAGLSATAKIFRHLAEKLEATARDCLGV